MRHKPKSLSIATECVSYRELIGWGLLIAVVLSTIGYSLYSGNKATKTYAPLVDAAMEIKLEATIAHLWLEEVLSGDRNENIETVWQHLDQSAWYAEAMLEGGNNAEGTFSPLADPVLRREIESVSVKLLQFRRVAEQRYADREYSAAGSEIDERFDAVFYDFMTQADCVETALQKLMHRERIRFIIIECVLAIVCLAIAVLIASVLHRDRAQLAAALEEADQQSNSRLQALEELQANEAWLRLSTETAGVAIWEYDLIMDRMARSQNHDQLYGMEPQKIWTKETFLNALHPDDRERATRLIDQSIAAGGPDRYHFDYRTIWPDQSEHWLALTGKIAERNSDGVATLMRGCMINITERKRAEEELADHREHLEARVSERTEELRKIINAMAGRENRMAELKRVNQKLSVQLEEAGKIRAVDHVPSQESEGR